MIVELRMESNKYLLFYKARRCYNAKSKFDDAANQGCDAAKKGVDAAKKGADDLKKEAFAAADQVSICYILYMNIILV